MSVCLRLGHTYVQYSTVLYCTVPYCTVLYSTVLYCTVPYCTVQYSTVQYTVTLYSFIMKLIKANLAAEAEQHLHGALLLVLQQRQPQRVAGGVATDCLSILPAPDTAPQGATWQQHQLYAGSAPPAFLQ